MIIYYTGASEQDAEQLNPDLSLGGYVSDSQIPNDQLGNIFSAASLLSIQNKRREIKMITLKNNDGDIDYNLNFTFSIPDDSICKYKVAFVSPTVSAGISCFEKLSNSASLPYHATFTPVVDGTILSIPSLADSAYLGMWLMREYDYDSDDLKKKSCTDWLTKLEAQDADPDALISDTEESFSFTLDYEIGESSTSSSSSI